MLRVSGPGLVLTDTVEQKELRLVTEKAIPPFCLAVCRYEEKMVRGNIGADVRP